MEKHGGKASLLSGAELTNIRNMRILLRFKLYILRYPFIFLPLPLHVMQLSQTDEHHCVYIGYVSGMRRD